MKRIIFLFCLIGILSAANAQKVKTIRKETWYTFEKFEVLRSDKTIKNGSYRKKMKYKKIIVAQGQYLNNAKVGVWEYCHYYTGDIEQIYDYDNNMLLSTALNTSYWVVPDVDTMPVPIGGLSELWVQLTEAFFTFYPAGVLPKAGGAVFSFVVTADGQTKDFKVIKSAGNEIENELLKIIEGYEIQWIPARHEGVNVETEFLIPMHIIRTINTPTEKGYRVGFQTFEL